MSEQKMCCEAETQDARKLIWYCTRSRGHSGVHRAVNPDGHVYHAWEAVTSALAPPARLVLREFAEQTFKDVMQSEGWSPRTGRNSKVDIIEAALQRVQAEERTRNTTSTVTDLRWVNSLAQRLTQSYDWSSLGRFQQEQRITRIFLEHLVGKPLDQVEHGQFDPSNNVCMCGHLATCPWHLGEKPCACGTER